MSTKEPSAEMKKGEKKPKESKKQNSEVFPVVFLPFGVLIVAALIGIGYSPLYTKIWSPNGAERGEREGRVIPIKKVEWSPSKSVLEYISEHPNEPVIFRMTQAEKWKARTRWTPEYLEKEMEEEGFLLKGAYVHDSAIFGPYFDDSKPMNIEGVKETIKRVNEHKTWSPTAKQFFDGSKGPNPPDKWHYFTSKLSSLPLKMQREVEPREMILDLDAKSKKENMNVWIGMRGVSAACHYDGYDNINVQLYGRKQWNLYAPSNHSELYLFPFLHFHHAQTQVDVESPDFDSFPNFKHALRYEGITEPGEALYLPAMWFHNVITLDTSINVNSWVKTPTSDIMEVIASQLPQDISVHASQVYLHQLLAFLKKSPSYVRRTVTDPRYGFLFRNQQLDINGGADDSIDDYCLKISTNKNGDVSSDPSLPSKYRDSSPFSSLRAYMHLAEHFVHVSDEEAKEMRRLGKNHAKLLLRVPKDTLDIWLGNHIEYVLAYATQDPILTAGILKHCF